MYIYIFSSPLVRVQEYFILSQYYPWFDFYLLFAKHEDIFWTLPAENSSTGILTRNIKFYIATWERNREREVSWETSSRKKSPYVTLLFIPDDVQAPAKPNTEEWDFEEIPVRFSRLDTWSQVRAWMDF